MGLFDGLESLGFTSADVSEHELYVKEEVKLAGQKPVKAAKVDNPFDYIYPKEMDCPVCGKNFMNYIVRKSRLRVKDADLDLKTNYHVINANCYDVFSCPHCGYTALVPYFNRITDTQREIILAKITPKFKAKEYPAPMSLEHAAERYKLSLLNSVVLKAKAGQKAITCLKTAWVYRDMADKENELLFLKNALTGFKEAFTTEPFPIGAMDEMTVRYMMGELSRRTGDFQEAMKWISEVVVSRGASKPLKDKAMMVKDLIRDGNAQ